MNYGDFSNPPGGYNPGTSNSGGYNTLTPPDKTSVATQAPVTNPTANPKDTPDFTYLSTIYNGVGDFHTNHFIAYFDPLQNDLPTIESFYEKFCDVFSKDNIAKVIKSDRNFEGHPAFKFTLGGNLGRNFQKLIGAYHDDWVAMQMFKDGKSFYGTTLKRNWHEPVDDTVYNYITSINPGLNPLAMLMVEVNKKHFLAGRRSWGLGYDYNLNLNYVETAALERSSDDFYAAIEKTTTDLRQDIIDLWANLLTNFAPVFGIHLKLLSPPVFGKFYPEGYSVQNNVAYQTGSDSDISKAVSTDWFSKVLKRHPGLIQDL